MGERGFLRKRGPYNAITKNNGPRFNTYSVVGASHAWGASVQLSSNYLHLAVQGRNEQME